MSRTKQQKSFGALVAAKESSALTEGSVWSSWLWRRHRWGLVAKGLTLSEACEALRRAAAEAGVPLADSALTRGEQPAAPPCGVAKRRLV
jgi:hypothetical protein